MPGDCSIALVELCPQRFLSATTGLGGPRMRRLAAARAQAPPLRQGETLLALQCERFGVGG